MATEKTETTLAVEAAKYLIQLYYKTKYACDRLKLQKLIILSHLALVLNGNDGLLGDESITVSTTGLGLKSVSETFYTFKFNVLDRAEKINPSEIDDAKDLVISPEFQYDTTVINETKQNMLRKIFLEFGAFSCNDLAYISLHIGLLDKDTYIVDLNGYIEGLQKKYEAKQDGFCVIKSEVDEVLKEMEKGHNES